MKTSQCKVNCHSRQKLYLGEVLEVVELLVEEALDEASFPEAKNNKLVLGEFQDTTFIIF